MMTIFLGALGGSEILILLVLAGLLFGAYQFGYNRGMKQNKKQ